MGAAPSLSRTTYECNKTVQSTTSREGREEEVVVGVVEKRGSGWLIDNETNHLVDVVNEKR